MSGSIESVPWNAGVHRLDLGLYSRPKESTAHEFRCLLVVLRPSNMLVYLRDGVRMCLNNCTYCHIEIEVADQTSYLTQSQYTDTGLTSPRANPKTPDVWQGSHWSINF